MDTHQITTEAQLRELYREPSQVVQAKKAAVIDDVTAEVLARSPFFLLATADETGRCDVSPRGGPAGQIRVLDEHRVAFPDLGGNNLIDSLTNIVANGNAGLLVLTPGRDETLRIDGAAAITTDPDVLGLWDAEVRRPKVAVVITVANTFIHCAKAFRRSNLWDVDSWSSYDDVPDAVDMIIAHTGMEANPEEWRAGLDQSYQNDLDAEKPEGSG